MKPTKKEKLEHIKFALLVWQLSSIQALLANNDAEYRRCDDIAVRLASEYDKEAGFEL